MPHVHAAVRADIRQQPVCPAIQVVSRKDRLSRFDEPEDGVEAGHPRRQRKGRVGAIEPGEVRLEPAPRRVARARVVVLARDALERRRLVDGRRRRAVLVLGVERDGLRGEMPPGLALGGALGLCLGGRGGRGGLVQGSGERGRGAGRVGAAAVGRHRALTLLVLWDAVMESDEGSYDIWPVDRSRYRGIDLDSEIWEDQPITPSHESSPPFLSFHRLA